jgi:hypothetical protein
MTLGQFAVAVGAPKRWVQNATSALRLPTRYTEPLAQRLSLAREIQRATGMLLRKAYAVAPAALAAWPARKQWILEGQGGMVSVVVDVERFLSTWAVRLSLARTRYAERPRGRPRKHKRKGVALAEWYGEDISLIRESLKRTPEQRLQSLDQAVEELKSMKVIGR